jgi:hypothetical protein
MSTARASYVIIEHIKSVVDAIISPDTCEFAPGKFSAESSDMSSGTYTIVQNLADDLMSTSIDGMTITIYHQDFDTLQRILEHILPGLNTDNAKDNSVLYQAGLAENVRYHYVECKVVRMDHNTFIEGTEYFFAVLNLVHQYVELGKAPAHNSVSGFIDGE